MHLWWLCWRQWLPIRIRGPILVITYQKFIVVMSTHTFQLRDPKYGKSYYDDDARYPTSVQQGNQRIILMYPTISATLYLTISATQVVGTNVSDEIRDSSRLQQLGLKGNQEWRSIAKWRDDKVDKVAQWRRSKHLVMSLLLTFVWHKDCREGKKQRKLTDTIDNHMFQRS